MEGEEIFVAKTARVTRASLFDNMSLFSPIVIGHHFHHCCCDFFAVFAFPTYTNDKYLIAEQSNRLTSSKASQQLQTWRLRTVEKS